MQNYDLTDKAVLFFCCAVISLMQPLGVWQILPVLAGAIAVGLITYFATLSIRLIIGATFFLACIFYQPLCAFIPVMVYTAYENELQFLAPAALLPLAAAGDLALTVQLVIVALAVTAVILKHRTKRFLELRSHYLSLLDKTREMAAKIKKQSKFVIEKQDDKIRLARLNERNRIAREIHDHVGHRLASAFLQIGAMLTQNPRQPQLIALKETLNLAMNDIRSSVHSLYESSSKLDDQLEQLAAGLISCQVELKINIQADPDLSVKYALLATVKEAFANITRHADATLVRLNLTEHPAFYQLVISDNGRAAFVDFEKGIGLRSIRERVEALNGYFLIRTVNGFEIFVTIPKEAARETADRR